MTKKKVNENKKIIFSNMTSNSYCSEDCPKDGSCDCEYIALQDELYNLNIKLPGRVIAIADIGRWNGRRLGYKILTDNVKSILSSECDYVEWFSDGRNIKATMHHHDGTNYVEYRIIREGKNIENLTSKLYNGESVTRQMINYYTESLHPYVAKVYGW